MAARDGPHVHSGSRGDAALMAPRTNGDIDSPSGWWHHFCYDYHRLHPSTMAVFQRLSAGIEHFRTEDHRKDPFLLKIWLAYLSSYL